MVGISVDQGVGPSVDSLVAALAQFSDVSLHMVGANDIRNGRLDGLDLLIHPGGSGSAQGRCLAEDGREAIRTFVREGGGFIGICAGAYLASADYDGSLHVLDAKVIDRRHWNCGKGRGDIAMTDAGRQLLKTDAEELSIYYGQGLLLAPADRPDIEDYEVLATFRTEIARNGDRTKRRTARCHARHDGVCPRDVRSRACHLLQSPSGDDRRARTAAASRDRICAAAACFPALKHR